MARNRKGTKTSSFGTGGRINHNSDTFFSSKLYQRKDEVSKEENCFPQDLKNKIICSSREDVSDVPDSSVHLIITSPPYNISGKQ